MIVMAPVIYTAAVDFTLNMLVEGFGPETRAILLLPPRWLIVIFISTDVLSGWSPPSTAGLPGYFLWGEQGHGSDLISCGTDYWSWTGWCFDISLFRRWIGCCVI